MTQNVVGGGRIELILGPMFSGKTTEMLRLVQRHRITGAKTIVIKYLDDTRYDEIKCVTHDLHCAESIPVKTLSDAHFVDQYAVIGVDEGQFFPDLDVCCETWANAGKIVIVAALDGTFQRKPFGRVLQLVPLAEKVIKLKAICVVCKKSAAFSKYKIGEPSVVNIDIGGSDKYMAVCRQCFFKVGAPIIHTS
jgi:thymidine kinase